MHNVKTDRDGIAKLAQAMAEFVVVQLVRRHECGMDGGLDVGKEPDKMAEAIKGLAQGLAKAIIEEPDATVDGGFINHDLFDLARKEGYGGVVKRVEAATAFLRAQSTEDITLLLAEERNERSTWSFMGLIDFYTPENLEKLKAAQKPVKGIEPKPINPAGVRTTRTGKKIGE